VAEIIIIINNNSTAFAVDEGTFTNWLSKFETSRRGSALSSSKICYRVVPSIYFWYLFRVFLSPTYHRVFIVPYFECRIV